jgi:hypothetical protein
MKKKYYRYILYSLFVFLILGGFSSKVKATTIASQTIATTTGAYYKNADFTFQTLGTGLTGIPNSVTFKLNAQSAILASTTARIRCYTSNTYATGCTGVGDGNGNLYSNFGTQIDSVQQNYTFYFASTTYTLDPTKYYAIGLFTNNTQDIAVAGTQTNTYANGSCFTSNYCTGILDSYFIFDGIPNYSATTTSITRVNWPIPSGIIATSTTVFFNYDYFNNSTDTNPINQACIFITDLTQSQTLVPICSYVNTSGNASFSQYGIFSESHTYSWYGVLQATSTGTRYTSQTRTFTVGNAQGGLQTLIPPTTESQAIDQATSTNQLGGVQSALFQFFDKWPINWVVDITGLFIDLTNNATSTTDFSAFTYDITGQAPTMLGKYLPNATSTMASSSINTTITLFSTTTLHNISQMTWVTTARSLGTWILWIIFAGNVLAMVRLRIAKIEKSE